jgi:cell division protein FtsZ
MTLFEADEAANHIRKEVDNDAIIIFGAIVDPKMEGVMRVSVVATGMEAESQSARPPSFQQTSAIASAARVTNKDATQPFYATRRNEGVIEKIIPETMPSYPADAEQSVPSVLAKAQASHLAETMTSDAEQINTGQADSHAMDIMPELLPEAETDMPEITSDMNTDIETDDNQLSIMDIVNDQPESAEQVSDATVMMNETDDTSGDEVPFTLGKTVDITTEELTETKESTGLMRHITRLFSSHQQQEKKAEAPILSDVEPLSPPKAEPMFRSNDASESNASATDQTMEAHPEELNTKSDELSDQHDQISLASNAKAPELDMTDQKDEFDLEIPAFLRRQAN